MTLSDKRITSPYDYAKPKYLEEDVKEFIKELKEEFHNGYYRWAKVIQIINKLAGADLI